MKKRFEYRIETFLDASGVHSFNPSHDEWLERMNAIGAYGWEIINITSNAVVYLKREMPAVD